MSQDISNLSITWDDAGTVFDAIKFNVVNTNSASGSKVLNLQVDGSTVESTDKSGNKVLGGTLRVDGGSAAAPSLTFDGDNDTGVYRSAADEVSVSLAGAQRFVFTGAGTSNFGEIKLGSASNNLANFELKCATTLILKGYGSSWGSQPLQVHATGGLRIFNTAGYLGWDDTRFYRDAANTLAQRNGTSSQTFNIYNTYTSGTNYERGFAKWDSNVFIIGNEAGSGGGSGRVLEIRSAAQIDLTCFGTIKTVRISSSGIALYNGYDLVSITPGGSDVGKTSGRFGSAYLGSSLTGSDATPNIDIETAWNTTGAPSLIKANVTDTASDAASRLLDLQVSGSSKAYITKNGSIVSNVLQNTSGFVFRANGYDTIRMVYNGQNSVIEEVGGFTPLQLKSSNSKDIVLTPHSNTLAQRNGTSAQTLNIYNTYTSSTNYERLATKWDSNVAIIATEKGTGGGTQRGIQIQDSTGDLAFFGATPVGQQSTTGTTTGFVAGSGTAANDDSTYTGGNGTAAYTVGDIVLALKNLGILAAT